MGDDWIIWQLCDSAFPTGAFAHSAGLEAAWQLGEVAGAQGLCAWISAALHQSAHAQIPAVAAAWAGEPPLAEVDAFCNSTILNHVANKASRSQGQALLMACARTFDTAPVRRVVAMVREGGLAGHFAPAFGAIGRALGVPQALTCEMLLFLALRGAVSSAVRLGAVGPLQGQALQHRLGPHAAELAARCAQIPLPETTQTAPVADLLQAVHDRLYSRLFIS